MTSHRSNATSWETKLSAGQTVIIDGGNGTELQRRGVPMDETAWAGAAVLSHPDTVRAVHEDYIRAGAEVIITNTFSSTRQMLEPAGFGEHVETINRLGVELAIEARDKVADRTVAIAASVSPKAPGFDRGVYPSPEREMESYREAIGILADAGSDLIALELMDDTTHAARLMQAAVETDLPIWIGVSCKQSKEGKLVGFDHPNIGLADVLDPLVARGPSVVNIMHTDVDTVPAAIAFVRERWDGPIGVYPESGSWTSPNWNFVDVIEPEELVRQAAGWVQSGVRLLGGCCGTGPEHVRALRDALPLFERMGQEHPKA